MNIINKFRNMFIGKRDYQDDNKAGFRPLPMDDEEKDLAEIAKNGDPIPKCYLDPYLEPAKAINIEDIVDLGKCIKFLSSAEVDCLEILSFKYDFIKTEDDIERYEQAFRLLLKYEEIEEKRTVELYKYAEKILDDIKSLSSDEAHLKYDIICKDLVDSIHPVESKSSKQKYDHRKFITERNKEILKSKTKSRAYLNDFKNLSSSQIQEKYNFSETAMYNLRRRIVAKYGENF